MGISTLICWWINLHFVISLLFLDTFPQQHTAVYLDKHTVISLPVMRFWKYMCYLHGCLLEADSDSISLCLEKCALLLRPMKGIVKASSVPKKFSILSKQLIHRCYCWAHALMNTINFLNKTFTIIEWLWDLVSHKVWSDFGTHFVFQNMTVYDRIRQCIHSIQAILLLALDMM